MGTQKWTDELLGMRVKSERERRGWSQSQMATMLGDIGIHAMHPTTVAKIEAGDRSVRVTEAAALADLFGITVDALLGRQGQDDSTLIYAMTVLDQFALDAVRLAEQMLGVAADIEDQLESVEESFSPAGIKPLLATAQELRTHLDSALASATKLRNAAAKIITTAESARRGQSSKRGERKNEAQQ